MKRLTSLLHLLTGVALLTIGAYFFRAVAYEGKTWWHQQPSLTVASARSVKSDSASDDPTLGAVNLQVYGVLGQQNEA